MAAGVTDRLWSVEELIAIVDEMGGEPEDKLELEAAMRALRREAALSNVRGTSLIFALLSIPLSLEGFSAALASDASPRLASFLVYLGLWPVLLLSERWQEYIGDHFDFLGLYVGVPMVAWALIGVPMGLAVWKARDWYGSRHKSSDSA